MSNKYRIEHIGDILDLPDDAYERFMGEVKEQFDGIRAMNNLLVTAGAERVPGRVTLAGITFVDDGNKNTEMNIADETGEDFMQFVVKRERQ